MGKLLSDVERAGAECHQLEKRLALARANLREKMQIARRNGISMYRLAIVSGMTREGVRYILGREQS